MEAGAEVPSISGDTHPKLIVAELEEKKYEGLELVNDVVSTMEKAGISDDYSNVSPNLHDPDMPHAIGERFESDKNNNWSGPVFIAVEPSELNLLDTTEIMANYKREGLLRYHGMGYSGASALDSCINRTTDYSYRRRPSISSMFTNSSTWQRFDVSGNRQFKNRNYDQALADYRAALGFNCPSLDRQILLSNVVACRLQIGGATMVEAAVDEAKKCIAINDRWSKGHIRLASAYIALGGHYDDAFNSLQRALAMDPPNEVARQMLHKLRRDGGEAHRFTSPTEKVPSFEEFHPHPFVESSNSNPNLSVKPSANSISSINHNDYAPNGSPPFISYVALNTDRRSLKGVSHISDWLNLLRCPSKKKLAYEKLDVYD